MVEPDIRGTALPEVEGSHDLRWGGDQGFGEFAEDLVEASRVEHHKSGKPGHYCAACLWVEPVGGTTRRCIRWVMRTP